MRSSNLSKKGEENRFYADEEVRIAIQMNLRAANEVDVDVLRDFELVEQYERLRAIWLRAFVETGADMPARMPTLADIMQVIGRNPAFLSAMKRLGYKKLLLTPRLPLADLYRLLSVSAQKRFPGLEVHDSWGFKDKPQHLGAIMHGNNDFRSIDHFPGWLVGLRKANVGQMLGSDLKPVSPDQEFSMGELAHAAATHRRHMLLEEALGVFLQWLDNSQVSAAFVRREIVALGTQNFGHRRADEFSRYPTVRMDPEDVATLYVEGAAKDNVTSVQSAPQVVELFV